MNRIKFILLGCAIYLLSALSIATGNNQATHEIFLPIIQTSPGSTVRVSVASDGSESSGTHSDPSISGDGRYIVFESTSKTLTGQQGRHRSGYIHDRLTGATAVITVNSNGVVNDTTIGSINISADGRYVVFASSDVTFSGGPCCTDVQIYLRDLQTGQTLHISKTTDGGFGDNYSNSSYVSANGNFIVYYSRADNLIPGHSESRNIYLYNRATDTTTYVSPTSWMPLDNWYPDYETPYVSDNGRYVVFDRRRVYVDSNSEIDAVIYDTQTETLTEISAPGYELISSPTISADGTHIAYLARNDYNGSTPRTFYLQNIASGQRTAILTFIPNETYVTNEGSVSTDLSISANGQMVAFNTGIALVSEDTNGLADIYVYNHADKSIKLVSTSSEGELANGASTRVHISADGNFVTFKSAATNLVADDTNRVSDIFVVDLTRK